MTFTHSLVLFSPHDADWSSLSHFLSLHNYQLLVIQELHSWFTALTDAPIAFCTGLAWHEFHQQIHSHFPAQSQLLVFLAPNDPPPLPPFYPAIFLPLPSSSAQWNQALQPWSHCLQLSSAPISDLPARQFHRFLEALLLIDKADASTLKDVITREFARLTDAGVCNFFAFEATHLVLKSSTDPDHPPNTVDFPLRERSPFEWALSNKMPLVVADIKKERKLSPSLFGGYNDGSLLVLPLLDSNNNILALLSLHNKKHPPFDQWDLTLAKGLASHCSEALLHHNQQREAESKQTYHQALLNALPHPFALFRPNGELVDYNHSFAKMLQRTPSQLVKATNWSLTPPDFHLVERALFERYTLLKNIDPIDKAFLLPSGDVIAVQASITIPDSLPEPLIFVTYAPITTIHHTDTPSLANLKLILGSFGHDLNNVLSAIIGYSDMLGELVSDDSGRDLNRQLQAAVWRFRGLLQKMLALYRNSHQETAFPTVQSSSVSPNAHGERILLVDDDNELIELFSRLLQRFGYRVNAFLDPHQAIRAFTAHPDSFDIVVTDFYMPLLNGAQLLQNLRKLRAKLPIIMVTGNLDDLPSAITEDPFLVLFRKPFLPTDLHQHIQVLLAKIRALSLRES